ncbi:MAG: hypothetical protein GY769_16550 [bacterium]|nr:hypothetical protein [bacterium]
MMRRSGSAVPAVLALLVSTSLGCRREAKPKIVFGVEGCTACAMVIDNDKQASGYYLEREFHPFCSAGCLLGSFEKRRQAGQPLPRRIYFADYAEGGLRPVAGMTFLLTDHLPTVMESGILAFAGIETARAHRQHVDEVLTDWLGVRRLRGEPDRTVAVEFNDQAMIPEVIELFKGELVEWKVSGSELESSLQIMVRGYEELGDVAVPAAGEARSVRFLATRPGDGFPVQRVSDGVVLGRIRVAGPHTADEEES